MTMTRLFSIVLTLALCFTTTLYQAEAQQQVSGSNGAPRERYQCNQPLDAASAAEEGQAKGFSLMAKSRKYRIQRARVQHHYGGAEPDCDGQRNARKIDEVDWIQHRATRSLVTQASTKTNLAVWESARTRRHRS